MRVVNAATGDPQEITEMNSFAVPNLAIGVKRLCGSTNRADAATVRDFNQFCNNFWRRTAKKHMLSVLHSDDVRDWIRNFNPVDDLATRDTWPTSKRWDAIVELFRGMD
jgi:hypothetical protein